MVCHAYEWRTLGKTKHDVHCESIKLVETLAAENNSRATSNMNIICNRKTCIFHLFLTFLRFYKRRYSHSKTIGNVDLLVFIMYWQLAYNMLVFIWFMIVRSFIIVGRGPAHSGPRRWDLYIGPVCQPRERRGIGRCVLCLCMLCRVDEGTVGVSSLSGISKHPHPSRHGLLSGSRDWHFFSTWPPD